MIPVKGKKPIVLKQLDLFSENALRKRKPRQTDLAKHRRELARARRSPIAGFAISRIKIRREIIRNVRLKKSFQKTLESLDKNRALFTVDAFLDLFERTVSAAAQKGIIDESNPIVQKYAGFFLRETGKSLKVIIKNSKHR